MSIRRALGSDDAWIWLTGSAVATSLLMIAGLLLLVATKSLGFFWPAAVIQLRLKDDTTVLGQVRSRGQIPDRGHDAGRVQLQVGNRDLYGADFRWIDDDAIALTTFPDAATCVERREWGNFYGFVDQVWAGEELLASGPDAGWIALQRLLSAKPAAATEESGHGLDRVVMRDATGIAKEIALAQIVRAYRPNAMSLADKAVLYGARLWEFVSDDPRESNTEGGMFPAIFGTVMMVMLMSIAVVPFGVVAALYLREYARDGALVRMVRIAVNNLAGVPSIVFGVFGLGFFVYFIGGSVDALFFAGRLPTPTFGTGGILWAAATLALLTVPVVIVATEEALAAVPKEHREGSLALGATKFETIWRVVLPSALPGILTGLILAMARGAGEVAPLMITGVVKLAPSLPFDTDWPFLHLDRKFMHLGFHIYDVGFQSPNVEAAKPMVYATTLLLVLIIVTLNLTAILLRSRLRRRLSGGTF
jgi:phosphate transport system permease protein